MKRVLLIWVCLFICFTIATLQLSALPSVITSSGKQIKTVFDGLQPNSISLTGLANIPQSKNWPWKELTPRLAGFRPSFIIEGGNCPGAEACSGGFAVIEPIEGGCDAGEGDECEVSNFHTDPTASCSAGVQNIYCGVDCCV